jgi:hyperosmotically inducible protein
MTRSPRASSVERTMDMRKYIPTSVGLRLLALCLGGASAVAQVQGKLPVEEIRNKLLQLPYYGVFDFIAFSYDKGTVTLGGYAYHNGLKADAERAVKRAPGVDTVKDNIEDLSGSQMDDELRWKVYYKIYEDPFLSKYAPGGGMLWGHRHGAGASFHGLFQGMEPAGDYPIHIIVQNSRIKLLGVVDNQTDKQVAEIRAREVALSFGVENDLVVESQGQSTSR